MSPLCVISYATEKFKPYQKRLKESCHANGIETTYEYDDTFLKNTQFYQDHKDILDQERGAGYWLWKPFIILHTLDLVNNDTIVFYLDSHHFIKNPAVVEFVDDNLDRGVFSTNNTGAPNKKWSKRDCFVLMGCDSSEYWDAYQTEAGQIAFQKNTFTIDFLKEWINFGSNPNIITDTANTQGRDNFESFTDHRHDQAILTNLLIMHKIKRIDLCSLWGYVQEERPL